MAREELFALKIEVEEPSGWQVRGMMPISGPFVSDERVVPLDMSHVTGNQVQRVRMPGRRQGFWAFNSFYAMSYASDHAGRSDAPGAAASAGCGGPGCAGRVALG